MENDRADNKIKTKLFFTALSLTVALVLLVGASYAWFTISTNPEISGMRVNIYSKRTLLISDEQTPGENNAWVEHIDVSDKLGFYNQLVPVSTWDGIHWYIPTYKLSTSDNNQGTLNNPNRFIVDTTPENTYANKLLFDLDLLPTGSTQVNGTRLGSKYILDANLTATELTGTARLEAEKLGYYLYTDLWLKTEENQTDVRLSIPVNQDGRSGAASRKDLEGWFGTYVLPQIEIDTSDNSVHSLSNGSETAFRVGFLFYGDASNPNTPTSFWIYEPNADLRSSTATVKGEAAESRYVIDESDSVDPENENAENVDGHVWYLQIPTDPTDEHFRYKNNSYIETRPIKYLEQTVEIPEEQVYDAAGNPVTETVTQYKRDPATGQIIYAEGTGVRVVEKISVEEGWREEVTRFWLTIDGQRRPLYYMSALDSTVVDVQTRWPVEVRYHTDGNGNYDMAREERTGRIWVLKQRRVVSQKAIHIPGTVQQEMIGQYSISMLDVFDWEPDYIQDHDENPWSGSEFQMTDALGRNLYYTDDVGGDFSTNQTDYPVMIKSRTINGVVTYREERAVDGKNRLWYDAPIQLTDSHGIGFYRYANLAAESRYVTFKYSLIGDQIIANEPIYAQRVDSSGNLIYAEDGLVPVALTEKAPVMATTYEPVLETVQVPVMASSEVHKAEPTAIQTGLIIQKSSSWDTTNTDETLNARLALLDGQSLSSLKVGQFGAFYSQSAIYGSVNFIRNQMTWTDSTLQEQEHTRTEQTRYYDEAFTVDADGDGIFDNLENPSELGNASAKMITLYRDLPIRVRVFFWIEGQDADCWNDIASGELIVNIELAGYTVEAATD